MKIKSLLVLGFLCAALPTGCTPRSETQTTGDSIAESKTRDFLPGVKIVYSANIDGEIEPCGCRTNPTGGIHRRWNLLQQKFGGEKLSIDSGDLFYQSIPVPPFLEKQWNYQASILVRAYNKFGIEVFSPGELDLADGLSAFQKLISEAQFQVVSANLYVKATGKRLLKPYVILTKNQKRVGVFGLYDEALPLPIELEAKDHTLAAKEMVAELRGKTDVIIALTHEGLDKDELLAKEVLGMDAIFGAHTQSYLHVPEKVGDTLIFQPSFRGQHIGLYENGENGLYQVDARFDSAPGHETEIDQMLTEAKVEIARINKETDAELMAQPTTDDKNHPPAVQTFARCAECHFPQYQFHKNTAHFRAFETLVKAKQSANLDCLKCHTVGMQAPGGWTNVNKLVENAAGKPIDAESFAQSLPQMKQANITKFSKTFVNVQCENCHGAAGEHPFSSNEMSKKVSTSTCLACHTPDRAPDWYKNGKPNQALIQAKFKQMTCPRTR